MIEAFKMIAKILTLGKLGKNSPGGDNSARIPTKISSRGKKEKDETLDEVNLNELEEYQGLVKREPWNPNAHLKLAKIYEKKGERQKAIAEYFLVAEIFSKNGFYPNAMEIYKQVLEQDQSLDLVSLKIANTYQKMDLLEDAFSQYSQLLHHYHELGLKDKTQEIMALMAEFEQKKFEPDEKAYLKYRLFKEISKLQEEKKASAGSSGGEKEEFFDLNAELEMCKPIKSEGLKEISTEKIYGFEEILKELKRSAGPDEIYPNFNYHMGMTCLEMEFVDEAIVQFQMAIEKGQNPFEAARLLDTCLTKKGLWKDAPQTLGKISPKREIFEEIIPEKNSQLNLIPVQGGANLDEPSRKSLLPARSKV